MAFLFQTIVIASNKFVTNLVNGDPEHGKSTL